MSNSPEEVKKLIEIYTEAQQSIIKTIAEKEAKGNVTWFQKDLLRQVNEQLEQLNKLSKQWVQDTIPMVYQSGLDETIQQLNKMGIAAAPVSYSFSRLHTEAINELVQEALDDLMDANRYAEDSIRQAVKKAGLDAVTQKIAQGQTIVQCKKNLITSLLSHGIQGIENKRGRIIPLDVYAATVARSKTREATNSAKLNQLTVLGYDLVKMSKHETSCAICAVLQGRVYSISGKDTRYPPLSKAFTGPYANIHANCNHVLMPYVEELADDPDGDREYSNLVFDTDPRSQKELDIYNMVQRKKQQLRANRRQWERYSLALPDDTPKTFQGFMSVKRAAGEKWDNLQADYREFTRTKEK